MSADDAREELEAVLWQTFRPQPLTGSPAPITGRTASGLVRDILAAADRYADAARGEAITRMTGAAAARLAQAAAEAERVRAA